MPILYNLFQNREEEGIFPDLFYEAQDITQTYKHTHKERKKKKTTGHYLMNLDTISSTKY